MRLVLAFLTAAILLSGGVALGLGIGDAATRTRTPTAVRTPGPDPVRAAHAGHPASLVSRFDFHASQTAADVAPAVLHSRAYRLVVEAPSGPPGSHIQELRPDGHRRLLRQFDRLLSRLRSLGSEEAPLPELTASRAWVAVFVSRETVCDGTEACAPSGGTLQASRPHGPARTIARCVSGTATPPFLEGDRLSFTRCDGQRSRVDLRNRGRPERSLSGTGDPLAEAGHYVAVDPGSHHVHVLDTRSGRAVVTLPERLSGEVALDRAGTIAAITTTAPAGPRDGPDWQCGVQRTHLVWASPAHPQAHRLAAEPCDTTLSLNRSRLLYVQRVPGRPRRPASAPAVISLPDGRPRLIDPDGWQTLRFDAGGLVRMEIESCPLDAPVVGFIALRTLLRSAPRDPGGTRDC